MPGALVGLPAGQRQHQALLHVPVEDGALRNIEVPGRPGLHFSEFLRGEPGTRLLVTADGGTPVDFVLTAPLVAHRPNALEALQLQLHPERCCRRTLRLSLCLVSGILERGRCGAGPPEDGGAETVGGQRLDERGAVDARPRRHRLPVHDLRVGQRRVLFPDLGQHAPEVLQPEAAFHRPPGDDGGYHGHLVTQSLHRLPVHPAPVFDLLLGQRRPEHIEQPLLQLGDRVALPEPVSGVQRGTDQHIRVPARREPSRPRPGGRPHQRGAQPLQPFLRRCIPTFRHRIPFPCKTPHNHTAGTQARDSHAHRSPTRAPVTNQPPAPLSAASRTRKHTTGESPGCRP